MQLCDNLEGASQDPEVSHGRSEEPADIKKTLERFSTPKSIHGKSKQVKQKELELFFIERTRGVLIRINTICATKWPQFGCLEEGSESEERSVTFILIIALIPFRMTSFNTQVIR